MDNDVNETGSAQAGFLSHGKALLTIDDYAAKANISREQVEDKIRDGLLLTRRHKGQVFIVGGETAEVRAAAKAAGDEGGECSWPKAAYDLDSPEEIKRTYQAQTQVLANEVQLRWQWQRIAVFLIFVVVVMIIGSVWSNMSRQKAASAMVQKADEVTASFDQLIDSQQKNQALQQELARVADELGQTKQQLSYMDNELAKARENLAEAEAKTLIPADNLTSANDELIDAKAGVADLQDELEAAKQKLEELEEVEEFELFDLQDLPLLE